MNYWNRTDTWTTRDGTVLDLEDIEQDHAKNIIAMSYRQAETIRWYEEFIESLPLVRKLRELLRVD